MCGQIPASHLPYDSYADIDDRKRAITQQAYSNAGPARRI